MDVLAPQLMWIGSRCYRVNQVSDGKTEEFAANTGYVEEDLYEDDDRDADYEIEVKGSGRYQTSFHVPSVFYALIIGAKGTTRKRIESETKTQIKIPKQGVEGDITVMGTSRSSVSAARQRIELIVLAARNKQQFTHFISIPFITSEIKSNFMKFKQKVLSDCKNLDESLFQKPEKLHLTISTLSLMDNEDRLLAAKLLQDCKETIIDPILEKCGSIKLKLQGIEYMNDDPRAVDVLYATVESEHLQEMADQIDAYFVANGLVQKKFDHVKLHVTVINSLFRDCSEDFDNQNARVTYDATPILEIFKDFYFGTQTFSEIHLSQRYSTACNGFYEATGSIKL